MTEQTYILCFAPGTSGRFLSNIFWEILQQQDFDWQLSENNTCHSTSLSIWCHSNVLISTENPYEFFKFDTTKKSDKYGNPYQRQGTGLFTTHAWPDFDLIRSNPALTQTKFIIVTVDLDSLWEVFLNDFFKNLLVTLDPNTNKRIKTNKPDWLVLMYNDVFESDITFDEFFPLLTKEKTEILARFYYKKWWSMNPDHLEKTTRPTDLYRNPVEIPDDFKHRTLLLEYKDVYTMAESEVPVAVEKMAQFMNQSLASTTLRKRKIDKSFFTRSVIKKCNMYLQGRQDLIDKYKSYNLM